MSPCPAPLGLLTALAHPKGPEKGQVRYKGSRFTDGRHRPGPAQPCCSRGRPPEGAALRACKSTGWGDPAGSLGQGGSAGVVGRGHQGLALGEGQQDCHSRPTHTAHWGDPRLPPDVLGPAFPEPAEPAPRLLGSPWGRGVVGSISMWG